MMINEEHEKRCLECGELLGAGRSDRKYCDDNCRTAFNNKRRVTSLAEPAPEYKPDVQDLREEQDWKQIKRIQEALLDNRVKLMNMFNLHDSSIALNDFYGYGVNLKFFTSEYKDEDRDLVFRMCFDHGYHIQGDRVYLIYYPNELYTIL